VYAYLLYLSLISLGNLLSGMGSANPMLISAYVHLPHRHFYYHRCSPLRLSIGAPHMHLPPLGTVLFLKKGKLLVVNGLACILITPLATNRDHTRHSVRFNLYVSLLISLHRRDDLALAGALGLFSSLIELAPLVVICCIKLTETSHLLVKIAPLHVTALSFCRY